MRSGSGKSHTGCAIVLGDAGALFAKSSKQKIVTKSSTEAELVGLSDTAMQAIHLRNFVQAQGYDIGPVVRSFLVVWRGYHRTSGDRENVRLCEHLGPRNVR